MKNIKLNNNIIIKQNEAGFNYIEFLKLNSLGVQNLFTLRNLDFSIKPTNNQKEINYTKLAKTFNISLDKLIYLNQTHSNNILVIQKDLDLQKSRSNFDGIITNKTDIAIMTFNADCILFILYDKQKQVLGNIHSGWRGTLNRIIEKALKSFQDDFKSNLKDIIVCISPCIRSCHFEVEESVKTMFELEFKEINSNLYIKEKAKQVLKQKYYIDTIYLNKLMMQKMGILEQNIYDSNICSVCNKAQIHSYRGAEQLDKDKRAVFIAKLNEN